MSKPLSLTEGPVLKGLVRLSIPIILANLLQTAYQIIDTFWVGRLSAQAVAAVSLSFPINFLMIALGGGLALAGTVFIAQYKGKGDQKMLNHVAGQTILMVMAISVVLSIVGYFLSEPLMQLMGAEPDVLPDAVRFLKIMFLGFVFVFASFAYQSLMRGVGIVKTPMYIVLLTVILNAFLCPAFLFGFGPIPAMGVTGVAVVTLITQALAAIIGFSFMLYSKEGFHLTWHDLKPDWPFIKRAVRVGIPASIEQSTRALGTTVLTMMVATFGTVTVAAYGTGLRVLIFAIIPAMGFSVATSTMVGQNIGAGKLERAAHITWLGSWLAFGVLSAMGVAMFFLAYPLSLLFMPEGGAAIEQSAQFLRIMSLSFGFIGIQFIIIGTLRGAGDTRASMAIALINQWLIQFPIAWWLAFHTTLGQAGLWWSFTISNIVTAGIAIAWYMQGGWKHKKLIGDDRLKERVIEEVEMEEGVRG
jgi:putative MATE family efflux protein